MSTQQLEGLRPWITAVASKYSRDWHLVQDLAQEGWIAAWKAEQKTQSDNAFQREAFMKQAARWRILKCISDGAWLTDRGKRGWGTADPHRLVPATPALADDENELWTEQMSTMHEQLEAAYHSGEISRAVDSLTPKQSEYVRLRFWKYYNTDELTTHFGYAPYGLWAQARKKLQTVLAHMEKVV